MITDAEIGKTGKKLKELLGDFELTISANDWLAHSESFEHLGEYDALLSYLANKGCNHQNYRHYATRRRIETIINESALYLTDGSSWNDTFDRERFNPPFSGFKRFGARLSSSTEESVAMWMLYGGHDGNGAMINFDRDTLRRAMAADRYEFGEFRNGKFELIAVIERKEIDISLLDVLYFKSLGEDEIEIRRSMGDDARVRLTRRAFDVIAEVTKHGSWSYEKEVRLVAKVRKLTLGTKSSRITCMRIPLEFPDGFVEDRVFDSPVSDGTGRYSDSVLRGTVDWDLCAGCGLRNGNQ